MTEIMCEEGKEKGPAPCLLNSPLKKHMGGLP